MKELGKNILEGLVVIGIIVLPFILLGALDKSEYNNAIKRCGGKDNIVEKHTNQGDKYYECKEQ